MTSLPSHPHTLSPASLLTHFSLSSEQGLTPQQITKNRALHGPNSLPPGEKTSLLQQILEQFKDTLVIVLLAAAGVSFVLAVIEGEKEGFVEPAVILLILIINAAVGVIQENNAERAIEVSEVEGETR